MMKVKDLREALEPLDGELEVFVQDDFFPRCQQAETVGLRRMGVEDREWGWPVMLLTDDEFDPLPIDSEDGTLGVVVLLA